MNALTPNPRTGFLESKCPTNITFDSIKKLQAIATARDLIKKGMYPSQVAVAEAIGINYRTLQYHLNVDEAFSDAWKGLEDEIEDSLVQPMYARGRTPGGFMDRIALLRALKPEKWNPDRKVQITSDNTAHKKLIEAQAVVIDGELAINSDQSP